ncbi:MAG: DNA mismatch repair protein MutS [Spirochaetales bacterium]|nr:DNA mismatch repair protein MutS [Spirochaetales bacterium]
MSKNNTSENEQKTDKDTPMMRQYYEIKNQYPGTFIFFRLGDFYELFDDDALAAAPIMNVTLTHRAGSPMCGVPHQYLYSYLGKMMRAGKKVAVCEQMEDPKSAKGLVKREVCQVLTPGTVTEERLLRGNDNNFLMALNKQGLVIEIAYLDLSTGDFEYDEIDYSADMSILKGELLRIRPAELIIPENIWDNDRYIRDAFAEYKNILVNKVPESEFCDKQSFDFLLEHFGVNGIDELGIPQINSPFSTPPVLLKYVRDNAKSFYGHIDKIIAHNKASSMILDDATIRNLELLQNMQDGSTNGSLLQILDKTKTPMGCRLIKKWLIQPQLNTDTINNRLDNTQYFVDHQAETDEITRLLKNISDMERLVSRFVMNKANPKDLVTLKNSLIGCADIYQRIRDIASLSNWTAQYVDLNELSSLIGTAIKDEPAAVANEGNIVREGYNAELDELHSISHSAKEYLAQMEADEKKRNNAGSLRVKYNKLWGYYIEVSKAQSKNLDPDVYILRQNLVSTNRYTTAALSEYESKILTAKDSINSIEERIFNEVSDKVRSRMKDIQQNAAIIAAVDVFVSFASASIEYSYTRPTVNDSTRIYIRNGRHPVIERQPNLDCFIANDLDIDTAADYLYIITGPNMAGKSTYLRQCALITLMAQLGCYVPADEAHIGIVDRIFTRIGASDNLTRGQSTFYVEMAETANILANATNRSLLIMDEIGRGTATFDGMSLAWAIVEYIWNKKTIGAKTLFATHYHELTSLDCKEGIRNYSVSVVEDGEEITFLHKIIPEPAGKSYGIHVAKLANMPDEVVSLAEKILAELEQKTDNKTDKFEQMASGQLFLFDEPQSAAVNQKQIKLLDEIRYLNIDRITPLQALNLLADIQKKLKK